MRIARTCSLLLCLAAAGCIAGSEEIPDGHDGPGLERGADSAPRRTIFLNRRGGTYTPADEDDASTNGSSLLGHPVTVPAFAAGDAVWSDLLTCVQGVYARWNVDVTDRDPGDLQHVEAVVGGSPSLLGYPTGVGGVSQLTQCGGEGAPIPNERGVVYVFSDLDYYRMFGAPALCVAVAHEVGHAFTLEHETDCDDIMSYGQCGPKSFTRRENACGAYEPGECSCATTQNSLARLDWLLGRTDGKAPENQAPFVKVFAPAPGTQVPPGAQVEVVARIWDDGAVSSAEVNAKGIGLFPLAQHADTPSIWSVTIPVEATTKLRAVVTDDEGATTTTQKVKVKAN